MTNKINIKIDNKNKTLNKNTNSDEMMEDQK